jgi:hypothetical protein
MQRDSKRRLLRYFGIIADCRACTVLKILQDKATPQTVPCQSSGQIDIHSSGEAGEHPARDSWRKCRPISLRCNYLHYGNGSLSTPLLLTANRSRELLRNRCGFIFLGRRNLFLKSMSSKMPGHSDCGGPLPSRLSESWPGIVAAILDWI